MEFREFLQLPEIKAEYSRKFDEFADYFRSNYKSNFMDKSETESMVFKLAAVRTEQFLSEKFNKLFSKLSAVNS